MTTPVTFVRCDACGHETNAAAKFCGECGAPRAAVATPAYDRRAIGARPACPNCQGEQFRALSLIWSGGVSHVDTNTKAVGLFGQRVGVGGAKTKGVHVTELARRAAPPTPAPVGFYFLIGFIGGAFVLGSATGQGIASGWAMLGGFAVGCLGGFLGLRHNREVYTPALKAWQSQYMCDRCGAVFGLENGAVRI